MPARERLGFSGHETFPFRYGWLTKAAEAVEKDPAVFGQDRALVELGVGKNMVASIRHWGLATAILQEGPGRRLHLTPVGRRLLAAWDPYFEDPASLWVVHWLLVSNPERAATWHLAFHRFPKAEFTKAELTTFVAGYAERGGVRIRPATIARDVDCMVRTYTPARNVDGQPPEDSFDCPLVELNLIRQLRDGETYRFEIGPKPTLPAAVFGFALYDHVQRTRPGISAIPVQDLVYRPGSPGQAFRVDQSSVADYLDGLRVLTDRAMDIDETAGLLQVYFLKPVEPLELLRVYYERGAGTCGEPG